MDDPAAERARDADGLVAQALDHAPSAMAVLDVDGRFIIANSSLCELTGLSEAQLMERNFIDLVAPEAVEYALTQRNRMLAGEIERFAGEQPCRRADGEIVWVQLLVGALRGPDATIRRFIVQADDATARHEAAERLRASEQAALDASRMKSQFLANMSHEIRTPMNGVLGMIDALLHRGLTEEQERHAQTARRSAESLLTIIDDVLDFSKIEAGKLELEQSPIDLVELLEELRHLLWPRARDRGLGFALARLPGTPRTVRGDPVRVRQILVNLIINAIKFSERGDIVVSVGALDGDRLRFAVADQGIGIDADTLGRLFQPFTQADTSTTRRFGGTGLGLAISRQLAELMGGSLEATSVVGEGSTFSFTAELPAVPDAPLKPGSRRLAGLHALFVADLELRRGAAEGLVEQWGVTATLSEFDDAERAVVLDGARGNAPAFAVIVDPGGDRALELIARLRHRVGSELPCLLISEAPPSAPLPARVAGAHAPLRSDRFVDLIGDVVGVAPLPAPPEPATPAAPTRADDPVPGAGCRVLVAEDNEVNQQVAKLSLARRGLEVDVVADGEAAVVAAEQTRYDLIFMDCHMPRMDGFAATEEIQRRLGDAAAPIVALTASSTAEDRERCAAAGMDDFLSKPMRSEELDAILRRWLGGV
ncbi:ATP-binding protein [Baekduia sp. Peel2402]|uniref:ATP-binding protein n=1 Tax=Baekduia sp. Peel2402 TaxID=3458296 RepID=UPI00403ECD57